jgi:hypothetical protein
MMKSYYSPAVKKVLSSLLISLLSFGVFLALPPKHVYAAITIASEGTGAGTTTDLGSSSEFSVSKPATVNDDDYLVVIAGVDDDGNLDPPAGWTTGDEEFGSKPGSDVSGGIYYKKVTDASSEPSSYTFASDDVSAEEYEYWIGSLTGIDLTTPEDVAFTGDGAWVYLENDATPAAPSITTATAGAFVLAAWQTDCDLTGVFPGGSWDERAQTGGGCNELNVVSQTFAAVQATGEVEIDYDPNLRDTITGQFAFRPATGAAAAAVAFSGLGVGKVGQGLYFEGEDDYVSLGNPGTIKTLAFWMRTATTTLSQQIINVNSADRIETDAGGDLVATSFPASTIYIDTEQTTRLATSTWQHVIVTDTTGVSGSDFQFGSTTVQTVYGGALDDVRAYNRVLSAKEITRLYNLGATTHLNITLTTVPDLDSGVLGYWTFDGPDIDSSASTAEVLDKSGNAVTGDQIGFDVASAGGGTITLASEGNGVGAITDLGPSGEFTVTKPATVNDDDYLVVITGKDNAFTIDPPSGWTTGDEDINSSENVFAHGIFYKKITDASGEPASYTFTTTGADVEEYDYWIGSLTGVDLTTPEDVDFSTGSGAWVTLLNDTSPAAPSVTTATDGAYVLAAWYTDADLAVTMPGGSWDERWNNANDRSNNLAVASQTFASAGATGNPEITGVGSGDDNAAGQFAFRPAAATGISDAPSGLRLGKIGQGLFFEGDTDYVILGNPGTIKTIAFWMKGATTTLSQQIISINTADRIETDAGGDLVATSFPAATIYIDTKQATRLATSTWQHVVITDTTGVSGSMFNLGSTTVGLFGGALDNVIAYDRVLSADEITRLYDLGATTRINQTIVTQPDLENGLVGHWTFDGPDLVNNVTDRGSGGNNGFLSSDFTSTTTRPGKIGQALEFDGAGDDHVNLGINALGDLGDSMTIVAWVKTTNAPDDTIISEWEGGVCGDMVFDLNSGAAEFYDGSSATVTGTVDVTDGQWHQVVAVSGVSNAWIYVDGVLDVAKGSDVDWRNACSATKVVIGNRDPDGNSTKPFDGIIDDVRVYDRELSAAEIKQLYNLGR